MHKLFFFFFLFFNWTRCQQWGSDFLCEARPALCHTAGSTGLQWPHHRPWLGPVVIMEALLGTVFEKQHFGPTAVVRQESGKSVRNSPSEIKITEVLKEMMLQATEDTIAERRPRRSRRENVRRQEQERIYYRLLTHPSFSDHWG